MKDNLKRNWPLWVLWVGVVITLISCVSVITYYYYFLITILPDGINFYILDTGDLWVFMSVGLVGLVTVLFPMVLMSFRQVSIQEHLSEFRDWSEDEVEAVFGLKIKNYILPMTMLSALILSIGLGMIVYDLVSGYGSGATWIQMGDYAYFPTSIIEWAFSGAIIYVLQDMVRRYLERDLTPRFYFLSFNRILLAIAVSIIIFGIIQASSLHVFTIDFDFDEGAFEIGEVSKYASYRVFAIFFIVGFYPRHFFNLVSNWVVTLLNKIFNFKSSEFGDSTISLLHIEGVSQENNSRLREEGIYGAQNLAYADLALLAEKTPFGLAMLVDWKDQAALLSFLGIENIEAQDNIASPRETLMKFGFTRYSDLYYLSRLKKNSNAYKELKEMLIPSGLLEVLMSKGQMMGQGLRDASTDDLKVAAFSQWQVSPKHIKILLNEKKIEE